jgi:uncharacterized membrane protein YjgN (DUF898 family)
MTIMRAERRSKMRLGAWAAATAALALLIPVGLLRPWAHIWLHLREYS